MAETIFSHFVFQEFILPFLLVFVIVFAVLEKTKLLGEGKKILNAIAAFVVGLVFVTAVFPKTVITNLILFLTISLIIVFVILLIWGFIVGDDSDFKLGKGMKWVLIIVASLGVLILIIWTLKEQFGLFDWLSDRAWTSPFWTNFLFVIVIAVALALVLKKQTSEGN